MTDTATLPQSAGNSAEGAATPSIRPGFAFTRDIVMLSDPGSIQAESFGSLRTHLQAKHLRDGRRSLTICGPAAGVGCTHVSVNLAVSFALAGVNTLLIDGNMRAPGIERYIRPDTVTKGLRDCLSDAVVDICDAIAEDVMPNLSLIYSGGATENAQELLASRNLNILLDACMRDFEVTIIDTPPGNTSADARRIAMAARYAMVVAMRNDSYVSDVRTFIDELQADRATVIGTFLNDL